MRPINVSLDSVTWELAKKKKNFSEWVRNQLRSERNKQEAAEKRRTQTCNNGCGRPVFAHYDYCAYCYALTFTGDESI